MIQDARRKRAFTEVLTKADANLDKPNPSILDLQSAQLQWLGDEVIKKRRLPLTYTPIGSTEPVDYTPETLREHVISFVKRNRKAPESLEPGKRKYQRADDIFLKGSEILQPEFLHEIGYEKKKPRANKSKGSKVKTENKNTGASTSLDQVHLQASHSAQDSAPAASELQGPITDQGRENGKRELGEKSGNDEVTQQPAAKKPKTGSGNGSDPSEYQGPDVATPFTTFVDAAPEPVASVTEMSTNVAMLVVDAPPLPAEASLGHRATVLPSRVEKQPIAEISSSVERPQSAGEQLSMPVKEKSLKAKRHKRPVQLETNFPHEPEGLHPRTLEEPKQEALLAQAPQISGTHRVKSVDSGEEPRMISLDEYAKLKTKLDQCKARCKELKDQYDEVRLSNRELRAYMEICESTSRSAEANRNAITTSANTSNEPSWTEQETDPQKRLQEHGLPPLREDSRSLIGKTFEWPRPYGQIHDLSQHLLLCHQDLNTWMKSVHNNIMGVAAHYMKHNNASDGGVLRVVDRPGPGLEQIYKTFFGSESGKPWTVEARSLSKGSMTYDEFLAGLIGSAVHEMVFTGELPWSTADEWFGILDPVAPYWNEAMKFHGTEIQLDDVVWHGLHKQIMSRRFQIRVVMPKAFELAKRLAMVLEPQLELAGITGTTTQSSGLFQQTESSRLTEVFMAALTVKGLLKVMPIDYNLKWSTAGTPFDDDDMELQSGSSTYDVGAAPFVSRAVTPVLKYRSNAGNASSEWMKVLARGILLKTEG